MLRIKAACEISTEQPQQLMHRCRVAAADLPIVLSSAVRKHTDICCSSRDPLDMACMQTQESLLEVLWSLDEQALPGCATGLGPMVRS